MYKLFRCTRNGATGLQTAAGDEDVFNGFQAFVFIGFADMASPENEILYLVLGTHCWICGFAGHFLSRDLNVPMKSIVFAFLIQLFFGGLTFQKTPSLSSPWMPAMPALIDFIPGCVGHQMLRRPAAPVSTQLAKARSTRQVNVRVKTSRTLRTALQKKPGFA